MHSPASKDTHLVVPVERGVLHASLHVSDGKWLYAREEPQMTTELARGWGVKKQVIRLQGGNELFVVLEAFLVCF